MDRKRAHYAFLCHPSQLIDDAFVVDTIAVLNITTGFHIWLTWHWLNG